MPVTARAARHALVPAAVLVLSAAPFQVHHPAAAGQADGGAAGKLVQERGGGLHGYISMDVPPPPEGFGYGISFYSGTWPLLEAPLDSFQIGLPGTWILPDNRGYQQPLCPPGTYARDNWPDRGPSYRDVFQTIEGGTGFWTSTQFGSATPKYRMNGTTNCYSDEVSSPGWGFGSPEPLRAGMMGLVQLSNRLVVPPDGLTFKHGMNGELFGTAWMVLPLMDPAGSYHRQPTGDRSWTLFLNAANFKGPVAFWIPDAWSAVANGYPPAAGRTLDARSALMGGGAIEVNTVPYFQNTDRRGVVYSRIPKLQFPKDAAHRTVLMQDVAMYSADAIFNPMKAWMGGGAAFPGAFGGGRGIHIPACKAEPLRFDQRKVRMTGFEPYVATTLLGKPGSCSFGLQWGSAGASFPEYFRKEGDKLAVVPASQVPGETGLQAQAFAPAVPGKPYTSPAEPGTAWSSPGPVRGPYTIDLSDGSRVTYSWYRFVDQPALQHLKLDASEKARLQAIAERIQAQWPVTRDYMAPPSTGTLATLDSVLILVPPSGLEVGYVPIVTRQEMPAPARH